jgi:hypothetical protein
MKERQGLLESINTSSQNSPGRDVVGIGGEGWRDSVSVRLLMKTR